DRESPAGLNLPVDVPDRRPGAHTRAVEAQTVAVDRHALPHASVALRDPLELSQELAHRPTRPGPGDHLVERGDRGIHSFSIGLGVLAADQNAVVAQSTIALEPGVYFLGQDAAI